MKGGSKRDDEYSILGLVFIKVEPGMDQTFQEWMDTFIKDKKEGSFKTCGHCTYDPEVKEKPCDQILIDQYAMLSGNYDFFLLIHSKGIRQIGDYVIECIRSHHEDMGIKDTQTITGAIIE